MMTIFLCYGVECEKRRTPWGGEMVMYGMLDKSNLDPTTLLCLKSSRFNRSEKGGMLICFLGKSMWWIGVDEWSEMRGGREMWGK